MASVKTVSVYGVEAVVEASYGGGATFNPANDGMLMADKSTARISYLNDGMRAGGPGLMGPQRGAPPSGRQVDFEFKSEGRGIGVAYSAGDFPRDIHQFLVGSGHAITLVTTPGTESYSYSPSSALADLDSVALRLYGEGELLDVVGVVNDFGYVIENAGFCMFSASTRGILNTDPADAALVAITYDQLLPPKAVNLSCQIAAFSAPKVRRIEFAMNRSVFPKTDLNATDGHGGFQVGRFDPTLKILIERSALSTFNPYADLEAGTLKQIVWDMGTVQYNRFDFDAPQAQLVDIEPDEDEDAALWNLTYKCVSSDGVTDDHYTLKFD